jgi:Sec-independent protein secretion pathway component TatC
VTTLVEDEDLERMTLVEHLGELRKRLFKSAVALVLGSIVGFVFSNPALDFLVDPYCKAQKGKSCQLVVIDPLEGFGTRIKIAIFVFAAVITPSQDPITLFAMALPMYAFYELSILLGRVLKR